jgi:hypothetical protein
MFMRFCSHEYSSGYLVEAPISILAVSQAVASVPLMGLYGPEKKQVLERLRFAKPSALPAFFTLKHQGYCKHIFLNPG